MSKTLQELVDLTPEQLKAWKRLVRAYKDFEKAGGQLYHSIDGMSGYNGQYIKNIDNIENYRRQKIYPIETVFMQSISTPNLECFADDNHIFILKNGVEICDEDFDDGYFDDEDY